MRVVSLVPSVTETLDALGCPPIACTRFCERPDLAHVGGARDPSISAICELEPDLVVVDAEENQREDFEELVKRGVNVHVLHIRSLSDVDGAMGGLAEKVGARWPARALCEARPITVSAFVPIWRNPWMALGTPTYGTSQLAHLAVATLPSGRGPYPTVELAEPRRLVPDVVLALSEPYPFTTRQLPELASVARPQFIDGKDLFWWGIRTASAIERLAEMLESTLRE